MFKTSTLVQRGIPKERQKALKSIQVSKSPIKWVRQPHKKYKFSKFLTCLIPEMSAIFLLKPVCLWPLVRERAINRKRKATSGEKWWKYDHSRHVKAEKWLTAKILSDFALWSWGLGIFGLAVRVPISYFIFFPIKKLKLNATVFSSFLLTKNWRCSQRTFFSKTFGLQAAHMLLLFEMGKVRRWDLHN